MHPMKRRTVRKLRKQFDYEVDPLYHGGLYSRWRGKPFAESRHLKGKDALGNPAHYLISDFQDEWMGGAIIFPAAAQETIFHRFSNNLPDGLFEAVAFAMDGLLHITRKIGIEDQALKGETQAFSFGFFMNREWCEPVTKAHFGEDSVCLGIAGITYEFLYVVGSEFLRIFDQTSALTLKALWNVPDVLRLAKKI